MVEDIETAYTDRKNDLESAIAEFKTITEIVENQKVNIDNEISNLNKTKEEHERHFDASVKNMNQYFERRRKDFKTKLNSRLEEQDKSLNKKLKTILSLNNKVNEALHFAENGLTYVGKEDFCQIENLISARFQSLGSAGKLLSCEVTDMSHMTFLPCKVGQLDQTMTSNKWLLLIEYFLDAKEEIKITKNDNKEITLACLTVSVSNEPELSEGSNPFRVVLKSKEGREIGTKVIFNESKKYFEICSEISTSGEYFLELYLKNELQEKRRIVCNQVYHDEQTTAEFPFGHKERLDHMNPLEFRQKEMQCPSCSETFSFEDDARFPRVLPCLHVLGTDCIAKLIADGLVTCIVCSEKHVVEGTSAECFPKDLSRCNLSVYWKVRSEGDDIQCQEHVGVKASVWCKICGQLICDTCSRTHMEKGHQPMIPLPEKEILRSTQISALHEYFACEEPGHGNRILELYCITCEKAICHVCQFIAHQKPHEVQECSKVYEQRHKEMKELLQQLNNTQKKTENLSFHVREEIDILKSNVENQLQRVRKTFNNCKASIDARKKFIESELLKITSTKEIELKTQLKDLEQTWSTMETSSNRALDLMGFSSEVSFLNIYSTLKSRLQSALEIFKQSYVSANALIWFIDDFIPKRIENETAKMGSIWPGNLCFQNTKLLVFPVTPNQETAVLKLQFIDNDNKTVSLKNIRNYIKAEISDSSGRKLEPKHVILSYGDDGVVSVNATIPESGDYNIVFFILGTAVIKEGVNVKVEALDNDETKKAENTAKDTEQTKTASEGKASVLEIGQKTEEVVQIEDSWQRETREQRAMIDKLQNENTQLKTSMAEKEKSLKGTKDKLDQDLKKTQEAQKKATDELAKKNQEDIEKQKAHETKINEKTNLIASLQDEKGKLTSSLEEKTKAATETENKLKQELETIKQTNQKQVEELKKSSQEHLTKAQALEAELNKKKTESEAQSATIKQLQDEIAKLKAPQPT